jgi:hypothetical protein
MTIDRLPQGKRLRAGGIYMYPDLSHLVVFIFAVFSFIC